MSVPVCSACGEPSPHGDPCETCAECDRILAMSDDEVLAEASAEDLGWARGFKQGFRLGLYAARAVQHANGGGDNVA